MRPYADAVEPTTPADGGSPALAQMVHQSQLATWLVRTIGTALVWLVLPALGGGLVAAVSGAAAWIPIGSFFGVVGLLFYLTSVAAPFPSPEVLELLEDGDVSLS